MKKILVKFSDERNKSFSICTTIAMDKQTEKRYVIKEHVYPEGEAHLKHMLYYADILKTAYPEVKICPVRGYESTSICFDFIEGVSLQEKYCQCMEKQDKKAMEELLLLHKKIILGGKDNLCGFSVTKEFQEVFGEDSWDGFSESLKVTNFDAIPSNVIFQDDTPVFIDYEWVYEFPVPVELSIYHCLKEAYLHIAGLEAFYPIQDAMGFLGVHCDLTKLQRAYEHFYAYVSVEKDGSSYALSKNLNLKGRKKCDEDTLEYIEKLKWDIMFFEKNWREACQAVATVNQRIAKLEKELENEKMQHCKHAQQLEQALQEQVQKAETYRVAYETVIHSRTWRLTGKIKRLFGRK